MLANKKCNLFRFYLIQFNINCDWQEELTHFYLNLGLKLTSRPSRAWYKKARMSMTNGFCSGDKVTSKSRTIVIKAAFVCAKANLIPVHILGPSPNGK